MYANCPDYPDITNVCAEDYLYRPQQSSSFYYGGPSNPFASSYNNYGGYNSAPADSRRNFNQQNPMMMQNPGFNNAQPTVSYGLNQMIESRRDPHMVNANNAPNPWENTYNPNQSYGYGYGYEYKPLKHDQFWSNNLTQPQPIQMPNIDWNAVNSNPQPFAQQNCGYGYDQPQYPNNNTNKSWLDTAQQNWDV